MFFIEILTHQQFQHKDLHPLPEDPVRDGRRVPDQEERHRNHHPEQMARLLAEEAVPQDEGGRHRHTEVGQEVPRAEAQGEEEEGCNGHQGFYQR